MAFWRRKTKRRSCTHPIDDLIRIGSIKVEHGFSAKLYRCPHCGTQVAT